MIADEITLFRRIGCQIGEPDLAVDHHADQKRVEDGDDGRFGRGEDAAIDAADDHDRHQQGQRRSFQSGGETELAFPVVLPQPLDPAPDIDEQGERRRDQDARPDAGDEQLADGNLRRHGVEDHRDRRRDDHAKLRRSRLKGRREGCGIAVADHRRDQDRADREGGGDAGARYRREDHAGQDAGAGEAALDAADDGFGEIHQSGGDAADLHQVAGQDEERDGGQRVAVERDEKLLGDQQQRQVGEARDADHARQPDRDGDGNAEREQHEHGDEDGRAHVAASSSPTVRRSK